MEQENLYRPAISNAFPRAHFLNLAERVQIINAIKCTVLVGIIITQ
jgi:hypothetical protein